MTAAVASGLTPVFEGGVEANLDRFCIWVVSPPGYVHSEAFADIADALSGGLEELGGSAPVVRSPDGFNDRTPIVLGGNLLAPDTETRMPHDAVIFNLEQVDGASSWFSQDYLRLLASHRVLDYSLRNRDALRRLGIEHAGLLEIGHADVLDRIAPADAPDIDVLFYGSINDRRRALIEALADSGLEVRHLFGVYGAERDRMIARSKLVLNVHYYASSIFEIVRTSYLLSNGVCVVTEGDPSDPDLAGLADAMVVGSYEDLPRLCQELVTDEARRLEISQAARATMQTRLQADCWRRTLEGRDPDRGRPMVSADTPLADVDHVTFLCPIGVTGGPEAIHQVGQMLRSLGVASDVMYFGNGAELTKRGIEIRTGRPESNPCATAYAGYEPVATNVARYGPRRLLIVPELLAAQAPSLSPFRTAIWWLSVDNALLPGRPLSDPRVLTALMQDRTVVHLHQSAYAREFLRSKGASSFPMGDFTDQSFLAPTLPVMERRPAIAYYPFKGGELAAEFFTAHPDLEGVAIQGMTKKQISELFSEVLFFVDFGHFPGKDRMPREAAVAGALVMLRSAGAGRFLEDFPLPDLYRFDDDDVRSGELYRRIRQIMADPSHHWTQQGYHRQAIRREPETLRTQLASLFGR